MSEQPRFAEPPDRYRKRKVYDWDQTYALIKGNPGQWLVLAEPGYVSTYNAITQRKVSNFHPDMGIEMRTSDNDLSASPRTATIWVRYNPDYDTSLTVKEREKVWVQIRKIEKEKKMKVSTVESDG